MSRLIFEPVPATDDPTILSKADITAALKARPGKSARIASHDRRTRAEAHALRINDGREYGDGFSAIARQIGGDHIVFAWAH